VQITIEDAQKKSLTIELTPKIIMLAVLALTGFVIGMAFALHAVGMTKWVGYVETQTPTVVLEQPDFAQQEALMRQNLDLLAQRVGALQAKVVQLDALGERVANLAGVAPAFNFKEVPGRGGLLVDPQPLSLSEVGEELDRLEAQLRDRSDFFSVIDAQLTTLSARKTMTPTIMPVTQGFNGSSFGWRVDPITGRRSKHEGIDFSAPKGTSIVAAAGGVVVKAEYHAAYGYMIDLDHGNDLITRYAHASKLLVKAGDLVRRGQKIAQVGSTGRSTGAHLHFEVRIAGLAVDPNNFLASARKPVPHNATLARSPALAKD